MNSKTMPRGAFTEYIIATVNDLMTQKYIFNNTVEDNLSSLEKYVICDTEDMQVLKRLIHDVETADD